MGLSGQKSGTLQGLVPSGGPKGESVSLPLPPSRGHPHSLFCSPIRLQSSEWPVQSLLWGITLMLTSASLFHMKEPL